MDALFGAGQWARPKWWGRPLVTFPQTTDRWELPVRGWHFDFMPASVDPRSVQVFAFIKATISGMLTTKRRPAEAGKRPPAPCPRPHSDTTTITVGGTTLDPA
jgi:hypothetical protein